MAANVSPLIPSETRPGYSVIPTAAEMRAAANNTKSVTPFLAGEFYIGYYNLDRQYGGGQAVFYNGNFYQALQPSQGISPENTDYWEAFFSVDLSNFVQRDINGGVPLGANWSVRQIGQDLVFLYNGNARVRFASNGFITATNDVAGFGTIVV